jgi:nicotinate phosphoribosyltransferase
MSVFNGRRLSPEVFRLDSERLPLGWYSDKYFLNIAQLLEDLARIDYRFDGTPSSEVEAGAVDTGNLVVEMQIFTRREPFSLIAGVDEALAILAVAAGYFDGERFVNTFDRLDIEAVQDGVILPYNGNPLDVLPVIKIRGRYRDFAVLETPVLGALSEATRVATNVFQVLTAAKGKDVLFFPARFAHYKLQALHGYAYSLAVAAFNQHSGTNSGVYVSTDEQGAWWGGQGGGTVAHSAIACFFGDTAEAMIQFCKHRPAEIPRIALVDFHNDCVGDTLRVMERMFELYLQEKLAGHHQQAERYRLFGIRADTGSNLRDVSVAPLGDKRLDCGVNPRLVHNLRNAIDAAWRSWDLPDGWEAEARRWCEEVRIVVTGGFNPSKIRRFEELSVPVDVYGVGSWLLNKSDEEGTNNDFTADVVRVQIDEDWHDVAKVGRGPCDNPLLERVDVTSYGHTTCERLPSTHSRPLRAAQA